MGIGRAQPLEDLPALLRIHVRCLRARPRSIAAWMIARFFTASGSSFALSARAARRSARSRRSRSCRDRRCSKRSRAACARAWSQVASAPDAGTMSMQSTGQGATHRSQPEQSSVTTVRSEEHTSELQSRLHLVCRLLLEKKKKKRKKQNAKKQDQTPQ